jgi:predicted nuclease with TOPRIM domain
MDRVDDLIKSLKLEIDGVRSPKIDELKNRYEAKLRLLKAEKSQVEKKVKQLEKYKVAYEHMMDDLDTLVSITDHVRETVKEYSNDFNKISSGLLRIFNRYNNRKSL